MAHSDGDDHANHDDDRDHRDHLKDAVLEIERHVGASGWDRPPVLFAMVRTEDLLRREPDLARQLGVADGEGFTPVEQEALPDKPLYQALATIEWPAAVSGCAVVQEVVALPPQAEAELPEGEEAATYAANHPLRQEIRLVVAVLRDGSRAAALRVRAEDDSEAGELVVDPDLAPQLADALHATLQ